MARVVPDVGDFPGSNAGASLKQRLHLRHGDIERADDFPGSNAGASLKRLLKGERQIKAHEDFPGSNAGASLKRDAHGLRAFDS